MTLELLSKAQLQIINRRGLQYPLDAAEKDANKILSQTYSLGMGEEFAPKDFLNLGRHDDTVLPKRNNNPLRDANAAHQILKARIRSQGVPPLKRL
jgi:hypothetical protein